MDSDAAAGHLGTDALQWSCVTILADALAATGIKACMYSHVAYNQKIGGKNIVDSCSA